MRGWWSTRPKAKIWDGGSARAYERPAPKSVETAEDTPAPTPWRTPPPPEPEPAPEPAREPAPDEFAPNAPPFAALFDSPPGSRPRAATPPRPAPTPLAPASPEVDIPRVAPTPIGAAFRSAIDDGSVTASYEPVRVPAPASAPVAAPTPVAGPDTQAEFLRLLEVVTSMCDHVIEYIEADRAERQQMMETLSQLGRVITEGAEAAVAAFSARPVADATQAIEAPAETLTTTPGEPWAFTRPTSRSSSPEEWRERVIGGSVPAGPAPYIDLVSAESEREPVASTRLASLRTDPADIAVEVRGQFGDRWVDGFEICEVMTTPSGPRYRLRRQRDGVVLPELFDATNIRHDEAFGRAHGEQPHAADTHEEHDNAAAVPGDGPESEDVNGPPRYWSRS